MIVYILEWLLKHVVPKIKSFLKDPVVLIGSISWSLYNFIALHMCDNWIYQLNSFPPYGCGRIHFNIWGYMYFILGPIVAAMVFKLSMNQQLLSTKWKCAVGITILWALFCYAAFAFRKLFIFDSFIEFIVLPMLFYVAFWVIYWIFYENIVKYSFVTAKHSSINDTK
jgi:hypothetical protein